MSKSNVEVGCLSRLLLTSYSEARSLTRVQSSQIRPGYLANLLRGSSPSASWGLSSQTGDRTCQAGFKPLSLHMLGKHFICWAITLAVFLRIIPYGKEIQAVAVAWCWHFLTLRSQVLLIRCLFCCLLNNNLKSHRYPWFLNLEALVTWTCRFCPVKLGPCPRRYLFTLVPSVHQAHWVILAQTNVRISVLVSLTVQ